MLSFVLEVLNLKPISNSCTCFLVTAFHKCVIENLPSHNANSHYKMFNPMTIFQKVVKPELVCVFGIDVQCHTPGIKENICLILIKY